ncbi:uncharacterized protein LOC110080137 isoform X1 [Pogona vitticeps]
MGQDSQGLQPGLFKLWANLQVPWPQGPTESGDKMRCRMRGRRQRSDKRLKMPAGFLLRTRAGCSLLAPALMMVVVMMVVPQWAVGAEGPLEGNRTTIPAGSPLLLPASENKQAVPTPLPRGFLTGENTSKCMGLRQQEQQGSSRANSSIPLLEAPSLPVELEVCFQISAAALVFAAFSGCGITMPFCHPQKFRIRGKAWIWLGVYANGLAGLACAMALVAVVLWSYDQGFPAILIVPTILLLHIMTITLLIVVTVLFQLEALYQVTDRPAQRMLDLAAPGGVFIVIVTLSLLMKCICQLQEEKCVRPVDLTAIVAGAAGMCLLPFLTIVAVYCLDIRRRTREEQGGRRGKRRKDLQEGKTFLP